METQTATLRHDIRGILSPALLTADRLLNHADPAVKRAGRDHGADGGADYDSLGGDQGEVSKVFFFEKKGAKNFLTFGPGLAASAAPLCKKFFGSFFQKRTCFLT